jgi:hypothetical protein
MEFYQELGAVPMDEWTTFRLTGEALERLASSGESQHELSPVKKDARRAVVAPERRNA